MPVIGVLALQGDVREHLSALEEAGATAFGLMDPLRKLVACGLAAPASR